MNQHNSGESNQSGYDPNKTEPLRSRVNACYRSCFLGSGLVSEVVEDAKSSLLAPAKIIASLIQTQ